MEIICEVCGIRQATELHHKLSQSKVWKSIYPEYIHNKVNLVHCCALCHKWKPMPKWDEATFCKALGIAPRSKEAEIRKKRELSV